jgi:hypothetical protein
VTFPHPVGNHPFQGRLIPTHHVPLEKGDILFARWYVSKYPGRTMFAPTVEHADRGIFSRNL